MILDLQRNGSQGRPARMGMREHPSEVIFALAHPDARAPTRLVSVILVWTLSHLIELPGRSFRMGSQQF
jgi:hypothetical protein